jgi:hypothetical protein
MSWSAGERSGEVAKRELASVIMLRNVLRGADGEACTDAPPCGSIFAACALQRKGWKVCVVERAPKLKGRAQEWNISRWVPPPC